LSFFAFLCQSGTNFVYFRPIAMLGETHDGEASEQTESEPLPAAASAAYLEAEFDMHAAQLLLAPDENEIDHLASSYSEAEEHVSRLYELDKAREQLINELSRPQPGRALSRNGTVPSGAATNCQDIHRQALRARGARDRVEKVFRCHSFTRLLRRRRAYYWVAAPLLECATAPPQRTWRRTITFT
jgi:hypothetical protein